MGHGSPTPPTEALILPDQGVLLRRAELSLGINCSQPPITFTFTKDREFAQPLCPGNNIAYAMRLTNTSERSSPLDYAIEDALPNSTAFAGEVSEGGVFDPATNRNHLERKLGTRPDTYRRLLVFVKRVPDQTPILNQASATLSDPQIGDSKMDQAQVLAQVNCPGAAMGPAKWMGGAGDNDFSDRSNWDPPLVPGFDDDAEIPANSGTIRLPQPHELRSLVLGANTTLRIPGGQLILRLASKVNGLLVNDSGEPSSGSSLTIGGDVSEAAKSGISAG